MNCKIRVGFFSLRECGERPVGRCHSCRSPTCRHHLSQQPGGDLCSECAARELDDADDWSTAGVHSYREDYYASSGYRPHSADRSSDHPYDQSDADGFNEASAMAGAVGAVGAVALADSIDDDDGYFFDS